MSYFYDPSPVGLNRDIERHRQERAHLEYLIRTQEDDDVRFAASTDPMDVQACRMAKANARTYRHLKCLLEVSWARLVSKIGAKCPL